MNFDTNSIKKIIRTKKILRYIKGDYAPKIVRHRHRIKLYKTCTLTANTKSMNEYPFTHIHLKLLYILRQTHINMLYRRFSYQYL